MAELPNWYELKCRQHQVFPCPATCWRAGRTALSHYRGELKWARTYDAAEAAEAHVAYEIANVAAKAADYRRLGLDVPEQFAGAWTYEVWRG